MKRRLHFHSDCRSFAGCEQMLAVLLSDEELRRRYDISFSYRYSLEYEGGFHSRVHAPVEAMGLRLIDLEAQVTKIRWRPLRIVSRAIAYLSLLRYWYILWNTVVLCRAWRKRQIDVLHINNGGYPAAGSCTSAVFAARLLGVRPVLYVVNNLAASYRSFLRWPDYLFDRLVARWVTLFVTGSTCAAQTLRRVLQLPACKAINIPNGLPIAKTSEDSGIVRQRFGVSGEFLVIVPAVLEERKGHIYLFRALDALRQRGVPKLPVVMVVGDGPKRESLHRSVEEAGLQDKVRFMGHKSYAEYLELVAAADLLVLPSVSSEDFPNVVVEAMSMGKPVVASRLAGMAEQVEDGRSGFLVEPRDASGLADRLQLLAENPTLLRSLGQGGYEKFSREFSANVIVRRYDRLYDDLLRCRQ
jgi:glycosyltransferase involved in cell wall biosynthesis